MTYEDILNWWLNLELEDELQNQIRNRIGTYINAAKTQPNDFRVQSLAGQLNYDPDAYAMIASHNPGWLADLQKAVYGSQWNWQPEQVAKLLGYKEAKDMLTRDDDENNLPQWQKLIEKDKDPSEFLDAHYGKRENLEPGLLYKWLETAQKQYDNKQKYDNDKNITKLKKAFAPRVMEDLAKHGDYTAKDVIGDVGENLLQFLPWSRPFALGGKLALGSKSLGWIKPKVVHGGEFIASNAAAPLLGEIYDASVYNPKENASRTSFDPTDVLMNTATNVATAPIVGMTASGLNRILGAESGLMTKKGLRDFLSNDPQVTAMHKMAELEDVGKGASNLDLKGEIYSKVFGKPAKDIKKIGKSQREKWENYYGINKASTGDLNKDLAELNKIINEMPDIDPRKDALKNLKKEMEGIFVKPASRKDLSYKEFLKNRENVSPTAALGEDAYKYGLTEDGRLADVSMEQFGINPEHHLTPTVDGSRSAAKLRKEAMKNASHDKQYPRETEFDRAVNALENDPEVVAKGTKQKWYLQPGAKSFLTNKLGKSRYGEALMGKEVPSLADIEPEVAAILDDEKLTRMWDLGFVPKGNPNEPLMKAYKVYRRNKDYKPAGPLSLEDALKVR